jgi:hypothetical protein
MKKPQIKLIERTDADVDNSVYEIPVEHTDDYGNFYYTKLVRPCAEYDKEQQDKRDALQAEIDALKDKEEVAKKIAEKEAELSTLEVLPVSEEML